MRDYIKGTIIVILIAAFALASGLVTGIQKSYVQEISTVLALIAVALGYQIYVHGIRSLKHGNVTAQLFATIAIFIAVIAGLVIPSAEVETGTAEAVGYIPAAAIVAFIIQAGMTLENYIIHRTRGALELLIKMSPKTARIRRDGKEVEVPIEEVMLGETVLVKPGDKIPVDGTVLSGYSTVNQATITGESIPVEKTKGDKTFAGTMNENGALEVKVEKIAEDTTLAHIIQLVEEAQEKKAPIQNVADRFTAYFLPIMAVVASSVFVASYFTLGFEIALGRTVTVLLVACPCALAIAVPVAVAGTIGNASMNGIIIKGGTHIEKLKDVNLVAFDKTGTLTVGEPRVVEIKTFNNYSETEVIKYAAIAEKFSEHPLSKAIISKATEMKIKILDPTDFETIPGQGVHAHYGNKHILIGRKMIVTELSEEANQLMCHVESEGKTAIPVALDKEVIGVVVVADTIRENSLEAIKRLKGIKVKTVMLTGDNMLTAKAITKQMGIDEFRAELLPEDKAAIIGELKKSNVVAMVGDGINDAPALANADVGFAMGAAGSDVAVETADVALLGDDLTKVEYAISLSRKAFARMKGNIVYAFIWNIVALSLASFGVLNPVLAVILAEAGCISVVINSALLLLVKPKPS
ncbi:MAG: cation-translocating P-type ATPase [Candidatus Bathyarchaeota archaeon]|nr:cation-translocating P-type ATPase [Candidatus Bathyarchaeum tardum]WGM90488.1 MAG: cation-translocating P-type ATPase [Candidatus Bathyarchaeum tardum]WNZ29444.1 MAG: cation-translocating P-type ATPase [Candidatus Bathyarchaeota archaeon]